MPDNPESKIPKAQGIRQKWEDIPLKIRTLIEDYLGANVVRSETQSGGFSPGVASRLYTQDGRCFFLKALGTDINPTSVNFHRREIKNNAKFPSSPVIPKLLWSVDDADDTEWVAMLFDNINGSNPQTPWQDSDLHRVMQAMTQLSDILTPSPIAPDSIATATDYFARRVYGWQKMKANESAYVDSLDDWSKRHLNDLCELEKKAPESVVGNTLVHFDIRADNIVITEDNVWFVDWPHACVGTKWLDTILFAPSVAMQGGLLPEDLIQLHPACLSADPDALTATIVSMAGMFTYNALLPAPAGLPTLREFQATQGKFARQWIAERTGWK